jgi:hypothetical protein
MENVRSIIVKKTLLFWVPGIILASFLATYTASRLYNKGQEAAVNGGYLYENKDLGFSLYLPREFEYFQTQRADSGGLIKLEIFVPTSDREYPQEVPGYAKPVQVLIGTEDEIMGLRKSDIEGDKILIAGGSKEKTYAIKFWANQPAEWKAKWSDGMRDEIVTNLKIDG